MPSPFPGMDPYLEAHWRDVHSRLVIYISDYLAALLPSDLRARVEERVVVELPDEAIVRSIYPDVRVIQRRREREADIEQGGVAVAQEVPRCLLIEISDDPITETFLEIIDLSTGRRVVTCIEVLSLVNKLPGPSQELYHRKQQELLAGRVSLVEIDLLRSGERVAALPNGGLEYARPYLVSVRRSTTPKVAEAYPITLRERLPIIHVPLRPNDPDVKLDLQKLIDQCWINGGYDDIDYTIPPQPMLIGEDAAWAETHLRALREKRVNPQSTP